jgi:predicted NodU family carbamoyl transferase
MIDRVDKAAALQLFFEDMIFHVIEDGIHVTKATKLIWTGGTALNCITSMHLLDHFGSEYYSRVIGMPKNDMNRLHLWIPPVPGDSGWFFLHIIHLFQESHWALHLILYENLKNFVSQLTLFT